MQFELIKDILLSDTLVPDVFLSDIMPRLPSDTVKVYLYCIFLSKYNKEALPEDLAAKLDLSVDTIKASFVILEQEGLIIHTQKMISLTNIKEKTLSKMYNKKTTADFDPKEKQTNANIKRNKCIDSINKMFFQGLMSPSWYSAIDNWFLNYRFDEDVMVSLFKFCYDNNALNVKYIGKVAATWAKKNITNHWELEKYVESREKTKEIGKKIAQSLRLGKSLTAYEERHVEIWLNEYGYDMLIIEEALKLTVGKSSPFKYANSVLTNWHKDGIKNASQLKAFLEASPSRKPRHVQQPSKAPRRDNFQQRDYDDDIFNQLEQHSTKRKENDA